MDNKDRLNDSALIVASAFIGAFAARYTDKILTWPFPLDILGLVVAVLFLFGLAYYFLGIRYRQKPSSDKSK